VIQRITQVIVKTSKAVIVLSNIMYKYVMKVECLTENNLTDPGAT